MGFFNRLLGLGSQRRSSQQSSNQRLLRARFDAAVTNDDNRRHWANSDDFAANASISPDIRRTLRKRGRYEQHNNPYTDGMLQTLAADQVGTGPVLKMMTQNESTNAIVEKEFRRWSREVRLAARLRMGVETQAAAGEMFIVRRTNPKLKSAVKLDLACFEGDQIATPNMIPWSDSRAIDGIRFDEYDNPSEYHVLKDHPGDTILSAAMPNDYVTVRAEDVVHIFKERRPGQRRGIPRITSSLPIFAERRGFRQSVVAAARVAAELGGIMFKSNLPPDEVEEESTPMDTVEINRGMGTFLPNGYDPFQLKAEQPATTYPDFDDKLVNESARPLSMPFNIAACNSSKYNYASGRLDHQTYDTVNEVEEDDIEIRVLDRIFEWWLEEAVAIPGYLPYRLKYYSTDHRWLWRRRRHVDPETEAKAQQIRMESRSSSLTDELALEGRDIDDHAKTLIREEEILRPLGLSRTILTGDQLKAAVLVVESQSSGKMGPEASAMLLITLGLRKEDADKISKAVKVVPEVTKPVPESGTSAPGRNGTGRLAGV